jgi:membrane-associated phospholipid phosphatase
VSAAVRRRIAYAVGEVLAPTPVTLALTATVALGATPDLVSGLAWTLLAGLFAGVLPYAVVLVGVRRGRLGGRHIPDRAERLVPTALAGVSVAVGIAVLARLGAPREVVALLASQVVGAVVGLAVTALWKVSVHTAGIAGAVAVLAVLYGWPAALAGTPVVALVAWSRVVLEAHTWAQVLTGAALGAAVGGAVFALVR